MKFSYHQREAICKLKRGVSRNLGINFTKDQAVKFFYYVKVARLQGKFTGSISIGVIKDFCNGEILNPTGDTSYEKRYRKLYKLKAESI